MDLVVSPAGHLIFENNVSEIPVNQTIEQQISKAFTKSVSLGLLEILKVPTVKHLPPAFGYWRNLSECYLHQLCLDSDSNIFTPPSPDGIIGDFLDNMSKKANELNNIIGELVGISLITPSIHKFLIKWAEQNLSKNPQICYETDGLVAVAKEMNIPLVLVKNLVWAEIDDHSHLARAKSDVYPLIIKCDCV